MMTAVRDAVSFLILLAFRHGYRSRAGHGCSDMELGERPWKQACGTMLKNIMSEEMVNVVMDDGWCKAERGS
jgi:hypothetical protein